MYFLNPKWVSQQEVQDPNRLEIVTCVCVVAAPQWGDMKLSLMIEEANKISTKLKKNTRFSR